MDRWAGKVVLITGASSGIGAQITRALAEKGMKVIAAARRLDRLEELKGTLKRELKIDIYPMMCDVRKEDDILKVFRWAADKLGGVDVLVNNAGVLVSESIIEGSTENFHNIMDVNVIATAICSRELVKSVKKRNSSGHIININSLAGHYAELIPLPVSLYTASKYAVTAMTLGLRNELNIAKLDIKISSISPGAVKTDMLMRIDLPKEITEELPTLEDKDISEAIIYILSAPHHTQIYDVLLAAK